MFMRKWTIALLAVALLSIGILAGFKLRDGVAGGTAENYYNNLEKFQMVVQYINGSYFKKVSNDKLVEDAIKGMLNGLDPHTFYMSPAEMKAEKEQMQGSYDGIGVEFNLLEDTIYVVTPLAGGPSEKLGILAGDRIIKIDGKVVAGVGFTNNDVFKHLRGPRGSKVVVSIKRRGEKDLLDFEISRDKIPTYTVSYSYMPEPGVGYIRVTRFGQQTMSEFHDHLRKLKAQGMKDLILDLRGNPGGYLSMATAMADDFLSSGKLITYTEGRIPQSKERHESSNYYSDFEKGGLVVMMDEGSASASEIVGGAVQDWDRGILVGVRSFGKGLVQSQLDLPDGSGVRMVISRYFTPSGRCIQKPFEADGDKKNYDAEIVERYRSGEVYDLSKVKFPDSLKYKTNAGRTVYGGGGVLPDVFVPDDTSFSSKYLIRTFSRTLQVKYAYKYVDVHPEMKRQFKDGFEFARNYTVSEEMLNEFTQFCAKEGVPFDAQGYATSKQFIANRIKAQIGHALFGDDAQQPVFLQIDQQFQTALRLVGPARELERTGKFNPEWAQIHSKQIGKPQR